MTKAFKSNRNGELHKAADGQLWAVPCHPTQGNLTRYCPWGDSTTFGQVNDADLILNPTISAWGWKVLSGVNNTKQWPPAAFPSCLPALQGLGPLSPGLRPSSPCTQSQLLGVKRTNRDRDTVWWPWQSLLLVKLFEANIEESLQTQSVNECGEHTLKHHNGLEIWGSVSSYQLH